MKVKLRNKRIYIEESVIIVLFVCLFSKAAREYLQSYYLCYLFITFHELAHIVIAVLFGSNIRGIHIRLSGLNANLERKCAGIKGVLIYLAGPLSNMLLAIVFSNVEIIFGINIALAAINLIPINPLDGYNILNAVFETYFSKKTIRKLLKTISNILEIIITVLSIVVAIMYCNISLILLLIYIKLINLNSAK